ncbi:MAG: 5-formyltetrahydrofolate cyclo-ligase [Nannocystis sp.]|nr:5-formyltetrahydrofolate cyclo-ligase [Nannocystis sp.]
MSVDPEGEIGARKAALRRLLLARRVSLSGPEIARRSGALTELLGEHRLWREARGIAAFVGVRGEPDTRALLVRALAEGKRLVLPRVLRDSGRLSFVAVEDLATLRSGQPGRFGLIEPPQRAGELAAGSPGAALGVDLVLVPGLGFDRRGGRLGFGKGYYDRALAPLRDERLPARVGVCFGEFLAPAEAPLIPCAEHDVPVQWVVTELEVARCGLAGAAGS